MPFQKLGPGTHRVSGGRLEINNSSENAQQNKKVKHTDIPNSHLRREESAKILLENFGRLALNSSSENAQQNNTANFTGSTSGT